MLIFALIKISYGIYMKLINCNNYFITNWKIPTRMNFNIHRSSFNPINSNDDCMGNQ